MESAERLQAIVRVLQTTDSVGVTELAAEHGCSEMTIRRDLDQLAQQGILRRVRGGAVSLLLRGENPPFGVRELEAHESKKRIAASVADLVSDGEAVLLDSGTTTLEIAKRLVDRRLTVVPTSLQSAQELSTAPRIKLVIPGGELRQGELNLAGPLTEAAIRALRFDTAIIGCCALSAEHGMTSFDLDDAAVKQAAIASARRVIAVTDSSKFSRTAFAFVCGLDRFDLLVTDEGIPAEQRTAFEAAGVAVRIA
ncbi:DeoR/GlpR family DNA-binding transcription regulator [Rhizohabitans arisaemae]|uniref:DeoR/GlpR family DNA-binding transcription regulator n=1 Tax=Rhizohabitans arisaemae TaxID=2720610 RepID=UPI0024B1277D|nr:DeoR/GlpR family DNA-binding transcription regulator [Rhizohabitans arisaemae]